MAMYNVSLAVLIEKTIRSLYSFHARDDWVAMNRSREVLLTEINAMDQRLAKLCSDYDTTDDEENAAFLCTSLLKIQ